MKTTIREAMLKELLKLNAIYPNPVSIDTLKLRAEVWHEQLEHLSEEMFISSINLHIKQSKFFPTIADILECYSEVVRNIPKPRVLPEPRPEFTPEEEAERQELIRKFKLKRKKIGAI